jgi:hypothetical protein
MQLKNHIFRALPTEILAVKTGLIRRMIAAAAEKSL